MLLGSQGYEEFSVFWFRKPERMFKHLKMGELTSETVEEVVHTVDKVVNLTERDPAGDTNHSKRRSLGTFRILSIRRAVAIFQLWHILVCFYRCSVFERHLCCQRRAGHG